MTHLVPVGERLREVMKCVEEEHRNLRCGVAEQVREYHALGLEAGGQARAVYCNWFAPAKPLIN